MPPRAARQKNAVPAVLPVVGGSRLERLPAELSQSIFDFLHISDEYHQPDLIRPLSKHLLSFSTGALYQRIKIKDDVSLGLFCSTLFGSPSYAPLVTGLELDGTLVEEIGKHAEVLERNLEISLLSLINLKRLEVRNWDMAGKVVLSSRFGTEGGKALESIEMYYSLESIEGSLTEAWSHLRHLPVLSSISYRNTDPSIAVEAAIPPKLGGFEKVTKLECYLPDSSSTHATNFASLFSKVEELTLSHRNHSIRPNFTPFLDSLAPDSINSITLTLAASITYTGTVQFPVHQSLTRFPRLQHLQFCDSRIFDSELIEAIHGLKITSLDISYNCKLSYDLMHQLLSGITKESNLKKVDIGLSMRRGTTGIKYRDGAGPVVTNAILVPGKGWRRPTWSIITLPEARELERISIEKGVVLDGPIIWGLEVERAFEEEEKWLEMVMNVMRIGPDDYIEARNKG